MDVANATLEALVTEMRANTANDVEFARRVALACCKLFDEKADPVAAIRAVFRI